MAHRSKDDDNSPDVKSVNKDNTLSQIFRRKQKQIRHKTYLLSQKISKTLLYQVFFLSLDQSFFLNMESKNMTAVT